jgi:NADPH:quinone reductase
VRAVQLKTTGGPDVLEWVEVEDPDPGPTDLVVQLAAAGLNFIDTYHRSGLYQVALPFTPGSEGAGVVVAAGEHCTLRPGDRVAWGSSGSSYAELVRVPEAVAVRVPDGVDLEQAAAVMLQGMTAHYLVHDTFPLSAGQRCLIHAGAGGTGLLLIQMAHHIGAEVFTTVGSAEKAELAAVAGADHTILYRDVDFADAIEGLIGPKAIDVVYDGVGKAVFERSLDVLKVRGMMVTFGNASGPPDPIAPLRLSQLGSLFLTRPTLFHYVATRGDLERRAGDVFRAMADGWLDVRIGERVPLSSAADAHRLLEGRETTGKVLLVP